MTALNKDVKQRFGSISAFATALQQASQVGHEQTIISPRPPIDKTLPANQPGQPQPGVPPRSQANPARPSRDIRPQGSLMWSFKANGPVTSSPTVIKGIVYFGSNDGNLYALNATSFQKRWSFLTSKEVSSSPTIINNVVYFGSNDGKLYAVYT